MIAALRRIFAAAGPRLTTARRARTAAFIAHRNAVNAGDTRRQYETRTALTAATNDLLRAELGR